MTKFNEFVGVKCKAAEKLLWQIAASQTPGVSSMSEWIRRQLNSEALDALDDLGMDLETADKLDPRQRDLLTEDEELVGA